MPTRFLPFTILDDKADVSSHGPNVQSLIFNIDHIVSIKEIRIVIQQEVHDGFWIRTVNGKKYRALDIPVELKKRFAIPRPEEKAKKAGASGNISPLQLSDDLNYQ